MFKTAMFTSFITPGNNAPSKFQSGGEVRASQFHRFPVSPITLAVREEGIEPSCRAARAF